MTMTSKRDAVSERGEGLNVGGKYSRHAIVRMLFIGLAVFFLFYNLSDRLLWGDEAETALLGRNILKFGIPIVDDGNNFITQYPEPWESNEKKVWTWNTWLPYYLTALSFRIFGPTTFAARLPFVTFAFFSVILMRRAAVGLYRDKNTALVATALLVFSVPFLLHARQCRYFSLLVFGTLWLLVGYTQVAYERNRKGMIHVCLSLILLFYSSFISFVANLFALGLHSVFQMRKNRGFARDIALCYAITLVAVLPWVLYSGMLRKGTSARFTGFVSVFLQYVYQINFHIFPLILLLIPPTYFILKKVSVRRCAPSRGTTLLLFFTFGQLFCLSIFPFTYFRYLVMSLPVLIILEAHIVQNYVRPGFLKVGFIAILALTNAPNILSLYPWRGEREFKSPVYEFVREITTPYEDKCENVVTFLRTYGDESESVAMLDPGYPIMFYTNMKVIDGRYPGNRGEAMTADWILTESPCGVIRYPPSVKVDIPESALSFYEKHTLQVRDTPLGASRPDPDTHWGFTASAVKDFTVYRRLKHRGRE